MSRSPAFAVAVLAALAPTLAVAQFRALALAVTVGLLAAVVAHRRAGLGWPWPRGPVMAAALALLGWLAASALWAAEPGRALATAATLGGFVLLGAAAARAVAADGGAARYAGIVATGVAVAGALAVIDQLTGHALRAAVRGLAVAPPTLGYGLKPAVSLLAVLLPVAVFAPGVPRGLRLAVLVAGLAAIWLVPAEAAKLAAVAGLGAALLARWYGAVVIRGVAAATAVAILVAPLLAGAILPRLPPLEDWPRSAAHRVLIWDFAVARIAERSLLGWGGEAARSVPGGRDIVDAATLDRFGLRSAEAQAWFARPAAQRLPLHVHNMALQLWLELGAVGALLGAWLVWRLGTAASRVCGHADAGGEPGPRGPATTVPADDASSVAAHGNAAKYQGEAAAAGAFAAAATVGGLSFGLWQEWWWGGLLLLGTLLAQRPATALQGRPAHPNVGTRARHGERTPRPWSPAASSGTRP